MRDWRMEEVVNQTIFRDMNEWTKDEADARGEGGRGLDLYLCECGDATCTDPISLTAEEYERVRTRPVRFAIAQDHENPEVDAVVKEFPRYTVVDKMFGLASAIAVASDPRRRRPRSAPRN